MSPERRKEITRWRDGVLWLRHDDVSALARLGGEEEAEAALMLDPSPDEDELRGCDFGGEPLDPEHGWWGHNGLSQMELRRRANDELRRVFAEANDN